MSVSYAHEGFGERVKSAEPRRELTDQEIAEQADKNREVVAMLYGGVADKDVAEDIEDHASGSQRAQFDTIHADVSAHVNEFRPINIDRTEVVERVAEVAENSPDNSTVDSGVIDQDKMRDVADAQIAEVVLKDIEQGRLDTIKKLGPTALKTIARYKQTILNRGGADKTDTAIMKEIGRTIRHDGAQE